MKKIIKILEQHSTDYRIENNRIIGIEYYTTADGQNGEEETDLTDFTMKQLYHWLGY